MIKPDLIVRRHKKHCLVDVSPQAIFWRSIECYAVEPERDEDDLDAYLVASFSVGNQLTFDLRHYAGHPPSTVTVYLPVETQSAAEIDVAINLAIDGLQVPETSVAWRRGEEFVFGELPRRDQDRLRENEARLLALKIAAECKDFEATTKYIKKRVPELIPLTPKDLEQSASRPREQLWQQIVGNVISHKKSAKSIFALGLAERTPDGLKVTRQGQSYLKRVGFLSD